LVPLAILFGLGSSVLWGSADFFAGLVSRRLPVLTVTFWSQPATVVAMLAVIAVSGQRPSASAFGVGLAAGVVGALALLAFYRALAIGKMSVVAPVTACGTVVPVVVALLSGEIPSPPARLGLAGSLAGILLVSLASRGEEPTAGAEPGRSALGLALAAAVGFGTFFVMVDYGSELGSAGPLGVVAGGRVGELILLLGVVVIGRRRMPWPGRATVGLSLIGLADVGANVLLAYGSVAGNFAVVAVLASLYPVSTVVLARALLAERWSRLQGAGVVLAMAGVGLMAAG
jgi:drug/metabolite transporter (DMT)-like permease